MYHRVLAVGALTELLRLVRVSTAHDFCSLICWYKILVEFCCQSPENKKIGICFLFTTKCLYRLSKQTRKCCGCWVFAVSSSNSSRENLWASQSHASCYMTATYSLWLGALLKEILKGYACNCVVRPRKRPHPAPYHQCKRTLRVVRWRISVFHFFH